MMLRDMLFLGDSVKLQRLVHMLLQPMDHMLGLMMFALVKHSRLPEQMRLPVVFHQLKKLRQKQEAFFLNFRGGRNRLDPRLVFIHQLEQVVIKVHVVNNRLSNFVLP